MPWQPSDSTLLFHKARQPNCQPRDRWHAGLTGNLGLDYGEVPGFRLAGEWDGTLGMGRVDLVVALEHTTAAFGTKSFSGGIAVELVKLDDPRFFVGALLGGRHYFDVGGGLTLGISATTGYAGLRTGVEWLIAQEPAGSRTWLGLQLSFTEDMAQGTTAGTVYYQSRLGRSDTATAHSMREHFGGYNFTLSLGCQTAVVL